MLQNSRYHITIQKQIHAQELTHRHKYFGQSVTEKIQCGKTDAAREDFIIQQFFSTIGCQTGLPNKEKILQHCPSLSISLDDLCVAPRPSTSTPASLHHHWASLCHPHRPSSDCAVCNIDVCLRGSASASPTSVLFSWCCT